MSTSAYGEVSARLHLGSVMSTPLGSASIPGPVPSPLTPSTCLLAVGVRWQGGGSACVRVHHMFLAMRGIGVGQFFGYPESAVRPGYARWVAA